MHAHIHFESDEGLVFLRVSRRRGGYRLAIDRAGERTEHLVRRLMDVREHMNGVPPGTVNALIARALEAD